MNTMREAIVLAGGFGTRLRHVVPDVCKPMAPVAGRPFLRFILDQLADAGFSHVIIADGYKRDQIEHFFGSFYRGIDIEYSPEDTPLLTGGAVKRALSKCKNDWVFVLNGDTYCDVDFAKLELGASNVAGSVSALITVVRMHNFDRYGTISFAENGLIAGFAEKKPTRDGLINAGVYLINRFCLDEMGQVFSLERDYFERVVESGNLKGYLSSGFFLDIGTPQDYNRAQTALRPLIKKWKLAMFDRDGTINLDTGHPFDPDSIELLPEGIERLRQFTEKEDYKVVVITNQAGIAKGLYSVNQMHAFNARLSKMVEAYGCHIDAFYYCPHHPSFTGECKCRKPKPGMLIAAMSDFESSPGDCVMFGDNETDRQAAEACGVSFCFVNRNRSK